MNETEFVGYRVLATRIILQAVKDYQGNRKYDVDKFINTEWFVVLAEIAGINPRQVRCALTSGQINKMTIRRGKVCLL